MSKKWLISVMATAMVFTLGLGAGCFGPTTNSSSSNNEEVSSSSTVTGTITLNAKTAQMDVYDTMQLTATTENLDGDVVWSSSNESVATVDQNGLVSALSVGKTTITAKVGDVEATCEVTTVLSEVAPVMEVSNTALQLKKGDSLSVTVSTTWKGKELNPEYAWYLEDADKDESDIVSIFVSEDGKTATFTGLGHGTETYCVSTFVNGMAFVETITIVSVDNDVVIEVGNLIRGTEGYEANLSLVAAEGHVASIKPEVSVYYKGVLQDVELDWTADNEEFAVMAEDGTISGLKPGVTTFQAMVAVDGKIGIVNVKVTVYSPEFDYEVSERTEFDLNGDAMVELSLGDLADRLQGTLVAAQIGEKTFATTEYAEGVVSLDKASIGNVYGDATITAIFHVMKGDIVASIENVTIPVKTYRSLSTVEELNNLANYVRMDGTSAYGDFRVAADIDFNGTELKPIGKWNGSAWTHVWKGTFDGQGHIIKNAVMVGGNGGLFNSIASGGVVKNVAFINAEVQNESGMIATSNDGEGLIENVFVHGKLTTASGGQNWAPAALIVAKNSGIVRNCFAVLTDTTTVNYGGMIAGFNKLNGVTENCAAINMSGKTIYLAGTESVTIPNQAEKGGATSKAYTSIADYYASAEETEFHAWVDGILQTYLKPLEVAGIQVEAPKAEVAKNGTTQLSVANPGYLVSWALKEAVAGVSIDQNGLVSATNEAQDGTTFTVVTTGAFGSTCEFEMTVVKETLAVSIDGTEYDASRNTGAPVDVSSISNKELTLRHVAVAGVMIEGATMEGGVVTVPNATLVDGETANVVTISVTDGDKIYEVTVPVVKITRVIMDKADLDWFGAESAKSQNKYYVLGANIEYAGVYSAAGAWLNNVLDGRGYVINNFTTNTGLLAHNGEAGNTPAVRDATVIRNIIFTNAKQMTAGKAIVIDGGGFTLKNMYISIAADTADKTYALWRDHYGNSFVYSTVVEYLGETEPAVVATCHDGRGIVKGVYAINATAFDQGGGSDKDWETDYKALFASWADFQEDTGVTSFFENDFWTLTENGVPMPKTLPIKINNTTTNIPAGTAYTVDFPGYASIAINEVEGVTLNGNVISVADTVAGGTKVVVTLTNAVTGETDVKELTVLANAVVNAEEVDFELTNETVSTAKLTEETVENVAITWNGAALEGATFENGVLTLTNTMFGQGSSDWGHQMIVISGQTANGMVTINVPVLAYKNVNSLSVLHEVGYVVKNGTDNFRTNVYGYFKLTADMDATGWAGNGTYDGTYKGANYSFKGTIDGQYHVVSNYTATTNRGLFFENCGTIMNLVVKNAKATGNSGIVVTSNTSGGIVKNVFVEGQLNATGANWCSAALVVAKNDGGSVIENCVTVLTSASSHTPVYQGLIAGYNSGTMKNSVAINLTKDTYYMAPRQNANATDVADEYAGETNVLYTSVGDYAATDNWAKQYVATYELPNLQINAESREVNINGALQLSVVNANWVKSWSLKEAVAGFNVDNNGVVSADETVAEGTTATVVVTGHFGGTAEFTVTAAKHLETVTTRLDAFEYDASRNTGAPVNVSSLSEKELVLKAVKVGGQLVEGSTIADGIVTVPNATLVDGEAVNSIVISLTDGDYSYEVSVDVIKITMVIKTVEDIDRWATLAYEVDAEKGFWGGYFVLGNNISYNKRYAAWSSYSILGNLGVSERTGFKSGFRGVFDGRGYNIDGVTFNEFASGFFGYTINFATVRNLSFTNVNMVGSHTAFLGGGGGCNGSFENVYVQMTMTNGSTTNNDKTGLIGDAYGAMNINNVFVDVTMADGVEANNGVEGFFYHKKYNNLNGVYVAGINPTQYAFNPCTCCGDNDVNVKGAYASRADMVAATDWQAEVATWDSSFWTTDAEGLPIPVSVKNLISESTITAPYTKVAAGGTVQLSNPYATAWALAEGSSEEFSVNANGLLTVSENATGSVTVIATLRDGTTRSIEITVVMTQNVTLDEQATDLRNGKFVQVDFTSYNITDAVALPEGATFENGVLTVPAGTTLSNWGKFTVKATLTAADVTYNFEIPVFAYVSLASQADFANMYEYAVKDDLGNSVVNHYAYYLMTADVVLDTKFLSAGEDSWISKAQSWSKPFCGIFDGQYKELSWTSGWARERGIFKQISETGVFKNVKFIDTKPFMNSPVANRNYGLIENVYAELFIQGASEAANASMGIASKNWGTIRNCTVIITGVATTNMVYPNMITWNQTDSAKVENCVAINLSGFRMVAVQKGSTIVEASKAVETADETNVVADSWSGLAQLSADYWAIEYLQAFEKEYLAISLSNPSVAVGESVQLTVKNSAYLQSWTLKEAVAGVSVSADGIVSVTNEAVADTVFTVVATGYAGTIVEVTMTVVAVAKVETTVTLDKQEYDASKNEGVTLEVASDAEITDLRNVMVGGKAVEGATFDGKNVFIPNAVLVDGETANEVSFVAETATTIYTVNASVVKITKVLMNVDDLNWFGANSNKSNHKYYVLGADIDYVGVYEMASGNWQNNMLDGRGYVINNFATSTSLIGIASASQAAVDLQTTVVKNLVFTNAKSTVATKAIVVQGGTFTMENVYVSIAADTVADTRGLFADHFGAASVTACVAEWLGTTAPKMATTSHNDRGIFKGVYGINVTAWDSNNGSDKKPGDIGYAADVYDLFNSWADFVENEAATAYFNNGFWTIANGIPMPKTLAFGFANSENEKVAAGMTYRVDHNGYANVTINEVAGITLSNGIITIGEDVAAGTKITVTITSVATDGRAVKELTVVGNTVIDAATLDFDLNNGSVSSAKLTDWALSDVSITLNGVAFTAGTFEDGVLTIPNSLFGKGKNDWGMQNFVIMGQSENGMVTINLPVLAFKSVTHINNLENIGFKEYVNNKVTYTYGYFKLVNDIDATGWQGNGTYSGGATYVFRGVLDGQNHVISNYTPNGGCRGLFFSLEGTVKNLVLTNVNANGNSGIIAHWFSGTMENVYVEGKIAANGSGPDSIGLLASVARASAVMKNCVTVLTSVTTATVNQGGMIGYLEGTTQVMTNCVFVNLSGKDVYTIARKVKGDTTATAAGHAAVISETNKEVTSWTAAATVLKDSWAIDFLQAYEAKQLKLSADTTEAVANMTVNVSVANRAYLENCFLKESVDGVTFEDGRLTLGGSVAGGTVITVVAVGYMGATTEFEINVTAKEIVTTTIAKQEYDASQNSGITLNVIPNIEVITDLRNVMVGGKAVEGATFDEKNVFIPNAALVDGEAANEVSFVVETATTIFNVNASVVKITKVLKSVDDLNWFGANSNKSNHKYYVLGADIDYVGVYEMASGNWTHNVLDGRGYVINNFATSTSLIGTASSSNNADGKTNTVVKNLILTNAKSTVAGKAIVVDASAFTLKNIYVSVAADTAANTRAVWRDQFGSVSIQGVVAEYLGAQATAFSTTTHDNWGNIHGVYVINAAKWESGTGSDRAEGAGNYVADHRQVFANWAAFAADEKINSYFDTSFWTMPNGIPMPKALAFGFANSENEKVAAGMTYRVDHNGYANVTINEVAGVTLSNGIITIGEDVAAGTKITVTITSVATDGRAVKELTVVGNTIIDAATLDFDLNNESVSSAKLTDLALSEVSMTLNGVAFTEGTFEDGVLTIPNSLFGKGQDDWGMQNFVIMGQSENGMVTINLPVLAFKSVKDLKNLQTVGYSTLVNTNQTKVYGYFKLTEDFDATGWDGNGTYSSRSTYIFYGVLDGQFHKVSNYTTISNNRGIFFDNAGTIKNLIVTNINIKHCSGGLVTSNGGIIENCIVEGHINSNGANWCGSGLIAAKNNGATGVIRNCLTVLTTAKDVTREETIDVDGDKVNETVQFDGNDNYYQATIAGFSHTNAKVENCISINLSGKYVCMVPGVNNAVMDPRNNEATEKANETNKQYTSWAAFDGVKDSMTIDDWATEYIAALRA